MERNKRNARGITLIALVVTIVVLLILAGVSISMLSGENGIITQAQDAKLETRGGSVEEEVNLWRSEIKLSEYSSTGAKSESDLIKDLKEKGLVFDEEINEEDKIITIGEREIYYGLEANDAKALKILVNSGDDGIVVLPIDLNACEVAGGYQIEWGDGKTGKDGTVVAQGNKLASTKPIYVGERPLDGIPHTYSEKNKEYVVTVTGTCNNIHSFYGNVTREKILEIKQWGETGLESIYLDDCANLRKIASPSENSFVNITNFNSTFSWCTSLTKIPEDLFANCPNVTSFNATFLWCTSLTEIPEGLFANCPNITDFRGMFASCTGLTGQAPELWTRGTNTEENSYMGNPDGESCFDSCTGLTNYDNIPDYWKRQRK